MPAIADIRKPPTPASTKALIALYESDRLVEAEALALELVRQQPNEQLVWKILSAIQLANNQFDNALKSSLRCLEISHDDAAVYNNVGIAHLGLGDLKSAEEAFGAALAIAPDYTKALSGLGNVHLKKRELPQAEALFRQALKLDPTQEKAWLNLGHICELRHKLTEAASCYERALEINPRNYLFISDLLQIVTHDAARDADQTALLHRQYGAHFDQFATLLPPCTNDKSIDRPLVIGLVTSDLRDHALVNYFEPLLQQFSDASDLTVHVYFGRATEDAVTKRMRRYIRNWHPAYLWDDSTLAHHIRTHQIDILIDLNGHTEANRLAVFAMRPAPVQMTWLGYLGTTGMSSMDYYIADATWLPNLEYSKYFTEHLALLPCATPFLPNNQSPSVNALPALTNGYITYGSFNRRIKLNDAVIETWSAVLRATPMSRMVLGAINESDQAEVIGVFAKSGISSDRLTFFGRMAQVDYLALHQQVDMCLDTFPFGGGATTAQAAWMGAPTVSLMGTSAAGRFGAAEMLHLGLGTFVAQSPAEFTSVAIYWADHVKELANLRLTLRARFLASPMGQYEQFAANLKGLMRAVWKRWCDGLAPAMLVLNDMPLETQAPLATSGTQPTPAALAQLWQLYDADQVDAAKQLATSILQNSPPHAQTLKLLGGLYRKSGDLELALTTHRSTAALYPDDFEAHFNLANELSQQGQFDEAIRSFTAALAIDPLHGVTYNNMSTIFRTMELNAEAEMYARQAIQVEPSLAIAHNNLGNALQAQGKFSAAQASYEQALALRPEWAEAYNNLAICLKDQCLSFEANAAYEKVLTLKPQWAAAHSNYLYCLSLDVQTDSENLHAAHVRFGEQHADPLQTEWQAHTNRKDPNRALKVGFVSADLYAHALTFFFEPWFRQLGQKSGLELHAYYTHFFDDESTKRLRGHFAFWHAAHDLNEEQLAQKIRNDEIDILFDLSGHTAHNRLLTFARKPAPIQVSYLGYLGTTGVKAIDYFLCDQFWIPPELGWQFTEKMAYLPSALVFQPSPLAPDVNPLPALANGFLTFGSFNRANKINDSVVALWSMLMKEVPTSKLLLGGVATDSHERIMRSFLSNGIALERIDFIPRSNLEDYLEQYHLVDFCLDTYPFGGGATTAHGIGMGVPTLSLAGDTPASRLGATEMHQLGLDSFIAYDVDGFLERGRYWASQLPELSEIRATMRQRLTDSPLGDQVALGNATEECLRTMWRTWCAEGSAKEVASGATSVNCESPRTSESVCQGPFSAESPTAEEEDALLAMYHNGEHEVALQAARHWLVKYPNHHLGWKVVGYIQQALGEFNQALAHIQRAVALAPQDASDLNNLGVVLTELGRLDEAQMHLEQAVAIQPKYGRGWTNLAMVYQLQHAYTQAQSAAQVAVSLDETDAAALIQLGNAFEAQGQLSLAQACYYRADMAHEPRRAVAYSNVLYLMSHDVLIDPHHLSEVHKGFGVQFESPLRETWPEHDNNSDPYRRLRLGFVSGDLCHHALNAFLEPAFAALMQRPLLELHAYDCSQREDATTKRMHRYFAHWHNIAALSDTRLADKIRADHIDILVDLSGHTARNRLLAFARKPAPVQMSWLGYLGSTGLQCIDGYISDSYWIPPELGWQFCESLAYLPTPAVFRPTALAPPANTLPAFRNGYITFGSFNRINKVNDAVIALWSLLLQALPDSRLVLAGIEKADETALLDRFNKAGIERERLTCHPRQQTSAYLTLHHEVDLCLDTFPHAGGATTAHAAWMGVPTLCLAGETPASRFSASLMHQIDLDAFVTHSIEEFVDCGVFWASQLEQLACLRTGLRERMQQSPLGRTQEFAVQFEALLRDRWQHWCAKQRQILPLKNVHVDPGAPFPVADRENKSRSTGPCNEKSEGPVAKRADYLNITQHKPTVQIISATKLTESEFWSRSALGQSLTNQLSFDNRLSYCIAYENSTGLPKIFNGAIENAPDDAILVFIHDDVWIDEDLFVDSVLSGLDAYDVIGVAGNRRLAPNQPAWAFIDTKFTWDDRINLSGRVAHGPAPFGEVSNFGPTPASCELLDGVFLATHKYKLVEKLVRFDTTFEFHFYDLDFCRSARKAQLSLGTWPIGLTHQSGGNFGNNAWNEGLQRYRSKWRD